MSPLISEGIDLVIYGMGTVFVFLTMLIGVTMLMSSLVARFEPAPQPAPARPASSGTDTNTKKMAAIAAAIHQHRSR